MSKLSSIFIFLLLTYVFFSCSTSEKRQTGELGLTTAQGGRNYGGILRINEPEYIKNLFPHNITDVYSYRIASQVYEGLFKFNPRDLSVDKSLVKDYDVDSTGSVYTFHLKENVFFHDDPVFPDGKGREMTADDVAFSFTQLCTPGIQNQGFSVFKDVIKGATAFYKASATNRPLPSVEGIKVIDRYTIEITLTRPNAMFLANLARPACFIFAPEVLQGYGQEMRVKAVGTGPFILDTVDDDIQIILKKNEQYHGLDNFGNPLPFLDAITISFIKDKHTEMLQFKKGDLDMIYRLSTAHINEILEDTDPNQQGAYEEYQIQSSPEMVTQFLSFNNQGEIFKDVNVRKAFNFAIDREKILHFVLKGEGAAPGIHGITPPAFAEYDIRKIEGYYLNLDSAKYYLTQAGYANGEGFPEIALDFNAEGERNTAVAVEIQKQLQDHLNIRINLNILPFAQLIENGYKGQYNVLKTAWYADFPNVENFLWLFYESYGSANSTAHPNIMRYNEPKFREKYEKGIRSKTQEEAYSLFMEAEQIMIDQAPVAILWYDQGYNILKSNVKNFTTNPMQYRDYAEVFFNQ